MSRKIHGLKAFCLSMLAVCGLMAFVAAGAQAEWLVNGVKLTKNETVSVSAHTTGKLIVAAKNLEIQCPTVESGGLELKGESAEAKGSVKFSGCKTFSPVGSGTENKNCNPIEQPIVAGGVANVILHNAKNYVLFAPAAGSTKFTTIKFSELCALTETSDVTGTLVAECGELNGSSVFVGEDCNVTRINHLIQPAPAALFEADKLKFGANAATLQGIAKVSLSGANAGKTWAGHV